MKSATKLFRGASDDGIAGDCDEMTALAVWRVDFLSGSVIVE